MYKLFLLEVPDKNGLQGGVQGRVLNLVQTCDLVCLLVSLYIPTDSEQSRTVNAPCHHTSDLELPF